MGQLEIRRAQPGDVPEMLQISAQVWDGNDYLPQVVDRWLADQRGELTVALADGRVVGFSKLTLLADDYGWLEGARVDKDMRGRGIGRAITLYHIERARTMGLSALAMATNSNNPASRPLAEKLGFSLVGEYCRYWAEPLAQGQDFTPTVPATLPPAPGTGLVPVGWTFYPWQQELLGRWRRQGNLFGFGQGGIAVVPGNRPGRVNIALLWGPARDVRQLLAFARHQPDTVDRISYVAQHTDYHEVLTEAGFALLDDVRVAVYRFYL